MFSKPILYAVLAMALYAAQNVVMEVKLSKYTTMALLLYWYFTMAPLALAGLGYMYWSEQNVAMPKSGDITLIVMVGAMFFFADLLYIGAYTNGGSLLAITTLVVLFPAMAQLIKYSWVGGNLNYYHLVGYIFAAIAVVLIGIGGSSQSPINK